MSNELGKQLVEGLEQLQTNLEFLHKVHVAKNLDLNAPYTINTENALKLAYVNQSLKALSPPKQEVNK